MSSKRLDEIDRLLTDLQTAAQKAERLCGIAETAGERLVEQLRSDLTAVREAMQLPPGPPGTAADCHLRQSILYAQKVYLEKFIESICKAGENRVTVETQVKELLAERDRIRTRVEHRSDLY